MRPFNLDEYLKDPSRKIVTRDGYDARIICTDRADDTFPIIALYYTKFNGGCWYEGFESYTKDGRGIPNKESDCDLFFADNPIPDFKPYDRVLTRGHNGLPWKANLFSNFKKQGDNTIAVCLKGDYLLNDIIPFDESKVGKIK